LGPEEAKIRREGFPLTKDDAARLLSFIDHTNPRHDMIEPEIIVKLELLSGKLRLTNGKVFRREGGEIE